MLILKNFTKIIESLQIISTAIASLWTVWTNVLV
jgi:hypothetical protein